MQWLTKRYNRAAFPDTFNERIRKVQKPIATALAAHGHDVHEIFIAMSSWKELPAEQPYAVALVATMSVEDFEDATKRQRAQAAVDAMEEKRNHSPYPVVTAGRRSAIQEVCGLGAVERKPATRPQPSRSLGSVTVPGVMSAARVARCR